MPLSVVMAQQYDVAEKVHHLLKAAGFDDIRVTATHTAAEITVRNTGDDDWEITRGNGANPEPATVGEVVAVGVDVLARYGVE